jgi:hypothetical protein
MTGVPRMYLAAAALAAVAMDAGIVRMPPRPMSRQELRLIDPIVPPAPKRRSRSSEARRALAAAEAKRERRRLKRLGHEARHGAEVPV